MNPLLRREVRWRWRDGRSRGLVLALVAGLPLLLAAIYSGVASPSRSDWVLTGHRLFALLAPVGTFGWLLIAPALTSASIAYERERGWFDALLLSPLLPRQIVLSKWLAALLAVALLQCVTLPFLGLLVWLGGIAAREFWLVMALHALCAVCGAALGIAASAWSYRSHVALRTAYGMISLGLLVSLGAAAAAGELPFRSGFPRLAVPPTLYVWAGRLNPLLRALEITSPRAAQNWPFCFAFLGAATLFLLGIATYYARRPLEEAPFLAARAAPGRNARRTAARDAAPVRQPGSRPRSAL